ncbi:MAG: hypothetical protein K9H61_08300 [Bacteroidia bacterium]|nr:hypothetical protein [Bacteroidia bacterium]MCF8426655.1 hypothetical protein [Bacteroidia bacterium]MCF8446983.1 hypothetical protein [Bacteroidia bacterium]
MKNAFTILTVLMMAIIFACNNYPKTEYSTSETKSFLKVSPNTTELELKLIAEEFKQKRNIDIDYSKSIFFDDGKIEDLVLKVNSNDGYFGETTSSRYSLRMKSFGFVRDFSKNAKSEFMIGAF